MGRKGEERVSVWVVVPPSDYVLLEELLDNVAYI